MLVCCFSGHLLALPAAAGTAAASAASAAALVFTTAFAVITTMAAAEAAAEAADAAAFPAAASKASKCPDKQQIKKLQHTANVTLLIFPFEMVMAEQRRLCTAIPLRTAKWMMVM